MSENTIEDSGACQCGSIKFKVTGSIMLNTLCHCKACSHSRGMSPVHLITVPPNAIVITEGKEFLKKAKSYGSVRHKFCEKCGSMIYQYPKHAPFRAILPTNFHIEDGTDCKLPKKYQPQSHVNYENRHYDYHDKLPKFKDFPPHGRLTNEGYDIHCDTFY